MVLFQSRDDGKYRPCPSTCSGRKGTPMSVFNPSTVWDVVTKSVSPSWIEGRWPWATWYKHGTAAFTVNQNETDMKLPAHFEQGNFYDDTTRGKRLSDMVLVISRLNLKVSDSYVAGSLYASSHSMRSWSASKAVWTDHNDPLKQITFTPVLPHDINNREVVYTMIKTKSLCSQLVHSYIPLFADEKLYSMANTIQLRRPEEVKGIVLWSAVVQSMYDLWHLL